MLKFMDKILVYTYTQIRVTSDGNRFSSIPKVRSHSVANKDILYYLEFLSRAEWGIAGH